MEGFFTFILIVVISALVMLLGAVLFQWGYNAVEMYDLFGGQEIDFEQSLFTVIVLGVFCGGSAAS